MDQTTHQPPRSGSRVFARSWGGVRRGVAAGRISMMLRLLLGLALGVVLPARAAVRFDVFVGYDGIVPQTGWFPAVFEVANDGPSFRGIAEISPGQFNQNQTRFMVVELPTGTTKRFVIPIHASSSFNFGWSARLLDADNHNKVRAEYPNQRVRKQNPARVPLLGALSRTVSGGPIIPDIKNKQGGDWQPGVARLPPALFPDNPLALEGLDVLYLNTAQALDDKLKAPQVNALLAWLHAGGHLVVGIDQVSHVTSTEWLRRLLPCEVTSFTMLPTHPELQSWVRGSGRFDGGVYSFYDDAPPPAAKPIPTPTNAPVPAPKPGTRPRRPTPVATPAGAVPGVRPSPFKNLQPDDKFEQAPLQLALTTLRDGTALVSAEGLPGSAAVPLVITARRGRGQITVLAFSPELEPFLSWKHRGHFWAKLADVPPDLLLEENYNTQNRSGGRGLDGVFGAMIDSKQVRKLPVGGLLLLLVAYLAVIGPLDQYWLKKINRQMLTWLTFPAYVALFSGLIYLIGYKLRAGETEWNELQVVDVIPHGGSADLRGHSFGSIYSPVNAKYELANNEPFGALRGEFLGNFGGGQEAGRVAVEQRGNTFRGNVSVPVWTSQLYVGDWWRQGPAPLRALVTRDAGQWRVEVENQLDKNLTRARLVVNGLVYELGDLPANKTTVFQPTTSQGLKAFVQNHGSIFEQAVNSRQRAFGEDTRGQIGDPASSAMAASFISHLGQQNYQNWVAPPGFDLSPLVARGDAVLLAWAPGQALSPPMNKFSARRSHHDTLLRLAVPVGSGVKLEK